MTLKLVEFLAPVNGKAGTNAARVLSLLYYKERYENMLGMTSGDIKAALKSARASNASTMNVSDVLNQAGKFVDRVSNNGKSTWSLTDTGRAEVRRIHGLPEREPEVEHDVSVLEAIVAKVTNIDIRGYLDEALLCLKVGALRATTVFVWTAAIRVIQENILKHKPAQIDAAIKKHDPKARHVKKIEDFSYIKDALVLLAAQELGDIDKSEKDTLTDALNLRNKCGHPVKYNPGIKKVSGFIEDVVSIVFK